jgi:hypothetical protein
MNYWRNLMKITDYFRKINLSTEVIAIIISVISLLVSAIGFYMSSLRSPDLNFVIAPYVKHVVDNASLNEAFFVPLTVINRGAKAGTVLSFDLKVTYLANGETRTYYGQYFTQENSQTDLGDFFTPITLNGYSSTSSTICFYPLGSSQGNLLFGPGVYEFEVTAEVSNVKDEEPTIIKDVFQITVDENMKNVMQKQPDGEYLYPLPIESIN